MAALADWCRPPGLPRNFGGAAPRPMPPGAAAEAAFFQALGRPLAVAGAQDGLGIPAGGQSQAGIEVDARGAVAVGGIRVDAKARAGHLGYVGAP
jgi:hypothetical protein